MNKFFNNPTFERVQYDEKTNILKVILRNGHGTKYSHENVPKDVYIGFKKSGFSNKYYYENIKNNYSKKIIYLTEEDRKYLNKYFKK